MDSAMNRCSWLALALAAVPAARGDGVSPYLPLDMPPQVQRQIERLLVLADRAVLRRPFALAAVEDALPRACERDAALCTQVRGYLARHAARLAVTDAQLEVAGSDGDAVPLANRGGMHSSDEWRASAIARWQPSQHLSFGVGAVAMQDQVDPVGTMISVGTSHAQLDIGFRERWSSALTDSSFLMSSEAAILPSVTLSNPRPLSSAGISYELFVARLSRSDRIAYQGRNTSGHPRLAGMSLSIEPVAGWSLGFNRQMQYGGGERGGSNAGDLLRAFVNPSGYDNTRTGASTDAEFGNQQAAWTSRFIYPGRKPLVVSLEYAGEDTSHSTAGRLGNAALSLGIHAPRLWKDVDVTYEISEWQNAWSTHHIYQDGMTNEGRVLGHWGMDRRVSGDAVGARSQMLRLGWTSLAGRSVDLQVRTLKNAGYSAAYHRANEVGARYSVPLKEALVGGELLFGRDVFGEKYLRVAASTRLLDAAAGRYGVESGDYSGAGTDTDLFAEAGMAVSRVRADVDGAAPRTSPVRAAPHLAAGLRRAVTQRGDLGVRLEFDRVEDETLLAVRAVDYRYRIRRRLAMTAFVGAARYDLQTPAYGYYLGGGLQWREILPRWDLNLDLRYADKVARDHVLPGESGKKRSDDFYDIYSVALSISHRL